MREAVFSIRHRGCWSSTIMEKYPSIHASLVSWVTFPLAAEGEAGQWSALWRFEAGSEAEMKSFLKYFPKLSMIEKMEVLYSEKGTAIIHETSHAVGSVSRAIALSKCHVVGTMSVSSGFEHWHIVAEKAAHIQQLLHSLEPLGEIKIRRIGRYEPARKPFRLTEKQAKALSLALSNNYYNWPRKATLEELALLMGVSRRTFQDHLRKAEAKALPALLQTII